jgi:exosortase
LLNHLYFAAYLLAGLAVFHPALAELGGLTRNELYSHIPLIPVVTLGFLWARRRRVFASPSHPTGPGLVIMAGALVVYLAAVTARETMPHLTLRSDSLPNDYLAACMLGLVGWIIGGFVAAYGAPALRQALFPMLFLLFMVPLPSFVADPIMQALQHASADASDWLFAAARVPYHRDGLVFEFSNVAVQVADVCSGIRSSVALVILGLVTGVMFLRTTRNRLLLLLSIVPITVVKNALRIVTLSLLANYVDLTVLTNHWLHSSGGIPFFAAGMALFIPVTWMFRRSERERVPAPGASR